MFIWKSPCGKCPSNQTILRFSWCWCEEAICSFIASYHCALWVERGGKTKSKSLIRSPLHRRHWVTFRPLSRGWASRWPEACSADGLRWALSTVCVRLVCLTEGERESARGRDKRITWKTLTLKSPEQIWWKGISSNSKRRKKRGDGRLKSHKPYSFICIQQDNNIWVHNVTRTHAVNPPYATMRIMARIGLFSAGWAENSGTIRTNYIPVASSRH